MTDLCWGEVLGAAVLKSSVPDESGTFDSIDTYALEAP